jgi:uncharacterized protein YkwD
MAFIALWFATGSALPAASENQLTSLEQRIVAKTNELRTQNGVAALQLDPLLSRIAREHSEEMMRSGHLADESPIAGRRTPEERYSAAFGRTAGTLHESVATVEKSFSEEMDAIALHLQLNLSRAAFPHAIDAEVSTAGVGCVQGDNGRIWATAMFAQPGARSTAKKEPTRSGAPKSRPPSVETPPTVTEKSAPSPAAERVEQLLVAAINEERGWGVGAQMIDPLLRQAARDHSADMMRRQALSHASEIPGRASPVERYEWVTGTLPEALFEAVATALPAAEDKVVNAIMTTLRGGIAAHRDNYRIKDNELPEAYRRMCDHALSHVGVGCAVGPDGRFWVTAMYAGEPKNYLDYVGTLSPEVSEIVYSFLNFEPLARADCERMGQPLTKFEVQWSGKAIKRGDPLELVFKVVRSEASTTANGWSGRASIDAEAGDLNKRDSAFFGASFTISGAQGKMDPQGRLTGAGSLKVSMLANDRAWTENERKTTWEAIPTDPSRREYQVFVHDGETRKLTATFRRIGSLPAQSEPAPPAPVIEPTAVASVVPPPVELGPDASDRAATSQDELRAADIRWLKEIEDALAVAERRKVEARGRLILMAQSIREWETRIAQLEGLMQPVAESKPDSGVEELFAIALLTWDEATLGPPPGPGENVRTALRRQIDRLRERIATAREEQDELIRDTLDTYYGGIVEELSARGPRAGWADVRTIAREAIGDITAQKNLAAAELYLDAGQEQKFHEAARVCLADKRVAADGHYLEALCSLGRHDISAALEGFRRVMAMTAAKSTSADIASRRQADDWAAGGNALWRQAREMRWLLEDGYLRAIDAKATGEAADVRAELADRLQKAGDEGWLGTILAHVTMGVVSATSAITGREESLVELATKYQGEVAAQHCGLLLLRSLHERGFPLDAIDRLDNEKFLALMRDYYGPAGARLGPADGVRLRAAVKAALRNPDVRRLASASGESLAIDAGRSYFGHAALEQDAMESWGDVVNMANVGLMLMPTSTLRVSGRLAKMPNWGWIGEGRAAGATVQTAREGFTALTGLGKLPAIFAETRTGRAIVADAEQFLLKSTWTERRAFEVASFLVAGKTGEAAGGTIGVMLGSDGKTEAAAGRLLAELFTMWTAGDADALRDFVKAHGITAAQLEAVARQAESAAAAAENLARDGGRHAAQARDSLSPETGAGIAAPARQAAARTRADMERDLEQALKEIGEGRGDADTFHRIEELEIACKAGAAVEGGAEAQAREWMAFLENRAQMAGTKRAQAAATASRVRQASSSVAAETTLKPAAAVAPGDKSVALPADMPDVPSFRTGNSLTKDADRLVIEGRYADALTAYQRRLAVCQQLKIAGNKHVAAAALPLKIVYVKKIIQARWQASQWPATKSLGHLEKVTAQDVARLDARADVIKLPVKVQNKSYTDPYWVMEKRGEDFVRVGIFKPSGPDFAAGTSGYPGGSDLRAEVLYADLARAVGVDVPACATGRMTIDGQLRDGVFIRMASGTRLGALGIGGPAAFKRQIAQDRVLALWLGDHDRHLGNYLATSTGEVRCIDHGMADFAGRVYGENAPGATGDVAEIAMTERLKKLRYPGDPKSSYGLWWVDDQITIEDMLPAIQRIQNLVKRDEKQLINLLEKTLQGRELEEALGVLRRRAEVLEKVIRANFGTIENLKPIPFSTASVWRASSTVQAA